MNQHNNKSGIYIKCIKNLFQDLIDDLSIHPYCMIGKDVWKLEWGAFRFIPLSANKKHKLTFQFPYLDGDDYGKTSLAIELNENEKKYYEYRIKAWIDEEGLIKELPGTASIKRSEYTKAKRVKKISTNIAVSNTARRKWIIAIILVLVPTLIILFIFLIGKAQDIVYLFILTFLAQDIVYPK